jgi:hypothetical protein
VVKHIGTTVYGGHYILKLFDPINKKITVLNDDFVTEETCEKTYENDEINCNEVFVLIYKVSGI